MEIGNGSVLEVVEVQSQRVYGGFHYNVQRRAAYAYCNIQFFGPYKRPAVIFEVSHEEIYVHEANELVYPRRVPGKKQHYAAMEKQQSRRQGKPLLVQDLYNRIENGVQQVKYYIIGYKPVILKGCGEALSDNSHRRKLVPKRKYDYKIYDRNYKHVKYHCENLARLYFFAVKQKVRGANNENYVAYKSQTRNKPDGEKRGVCRGDAVDKRLSVGESISFRHGVTQYDKNHRHYFNPFYTRISHILPLRSCFYIVII